jgi:hypothetical protein
VACVACAVDVASSLFCCAAAAHINANLIHISRWLRSFVSSSVRAFAREPVEKTRDVPLGEPFTSQKTLPHVRRSYIVGKACRPASATNCRRWLRKNGPLPMRSPPARPLRRRHGILARWPRSPLGFGVRSHEPLPSALVTRSRRQDVGFAFQRIARHVLGALGVPQLLMPRARGWQSVGERAINQLLDQLAVIGADRAGRLAHVDGGELLLGVDPEIGSGIAGPHELARRARHAGDPAA